MRVDLIEPNMVRNLEKNSIGLLFIYGLAIGVERKGERVINAFFFFFEKIIDCTKD